MLIDLMATDRMTSYNVDLAQIIGLHPAIYLSELINISKKATKKGKLFDEEYFIVDRAYITERTTFSKEEQESIEKSLANIGVIHIGKMDDSLSVDTNVLLSIFEVNKKDALTLAKIVKTKPKTKKEQICENLKTNIYATNQELVDAYASWIESVLSKSGWMSKEAVISGQQVVDKYANGDLDLALKIISIASVNGYRDMNWAVGSFDKNYRVEFYKEREQYARQDLFVAPTVTKDEVF